MNPLEKLEQLNLEPTAKTEVAALLQALMDQAAQDAQVIQAKEATIHAKDLKIGALTHELAYYRRIRFSTKSKALAPLRRDVFEETWNTDISAIDEEVEQLQDGSPCDTVARPKRPLAGRHRIICRALNTAMSRNPAPAEPADKTWSKPVLSLSKYR